MGEEDKKKKKKNYYFNWRMGSYVWKPEHNNQLKMLSRIWVDTSFITLEITNKQVQGNLPCWRSCGNKEAHRTRVHNEKEANWI